MQILVFLRQTCSYGVLKMELPSVSWFGTWAHISRPLLETAVSLLSTTCWVCATVSALRFLEENSKSAFQCSKAKNNSGCIRRKNCKETSTSLLWLTGETLVDMERSSEHEAGTSVFTQWVWDWRGKHSTPWYRVSSPSKYIIVCRWTSYCLILVVFLHFLNHSTCLFSPWL